MIKNWHIIPTGRVWVDPGGPFGLVPRTMWSKYQTENAQRLVPMDLNSLLLYSEGAWVLVDTGLGTRLSETDKRNWGIEYPEGSLEQNLNKQGLIAEDIDIVINTHLHSDHCSGNTRFDGDDIVPGFANAKYYVQAREYEDASHPNVRTRATYIADNFSPLLEAGKMELLSGDSQITSDIKTIVTPGHTPGHQCILAESEQGPVFFLSDLATFAVHFAKAAWVTAYDVEPLITIETKEKLQPWLYEMNALLVFQHDVTTRLGRLVKNEKQKYEIEVLEKGSVDF